VERIVDARGLACPLPALKARLAVAGLGPGDVLVVLATDPEAPIDVAAVAGDVGCEFEARREPDGWRLRLLKP
jgi:tRNA 2-thiouridine synthesizing protein A